MTCCAEDIQFAGLICQWENSDSIVGDSWHVLTARINFKFSRAYGKKGPVLTFIEASPCNSMVFPTGSTPPNRFVATPVSIRITFLWFT